jgi:hypothetical protein
MTLDGYLSHQERLMEWLNRAQNIAFLPEEKSFALLHSKSMEALAKAERVWLNPTCLELLKIFENRPASSQFDALASSLGAVKIYEPFLQNIEQHYHWDSPELQELSDSIFSAVEAAVPYAPQELADKCENHILPKIRDSFKKEMTFPNMVAVFTFLVAVFFGILQTMPDPQLQQIIVQNDVIIRQNEDMLAQNETLIDLQEETQKEISRTNSILNDLVDVLNALANKINFFSSADCGSDDGSNGEGQADAAQCQKQNAET